MYCITTISWYYICTLLSIVKHILLKLVSHYSQETCKLALPYILSKTQ